MTEFSGKGPRRWLDSADSCLVHTNPPRPPNHTDAHFRPHSKCCPQGQPDPRAAGRLQVAWVSDWRTPSCAGDRVQVALRRSGARERQAPARRGSSPCQTLASPKCGGTGSAAGAPRLVAWEARSQSPGTVLRCRHPCHSHPALFQASGCHPAPYPALRRDRRL